MANKAACAITEEHLELWREIKVWLYPRLNRFNKHGGRFADILANCYYRYDNIHASARSSPDVDFVDKSKLDNVTFGEICEWIAEYTERELAGPKLENSTLQKTLVNALHVNDDLKRELAEMKRQRDILLELDVHKALAEQREAKEVAEEALKLVCLGEQHVKQALVAARACIASRKGLQA